MSARHLRRSRAIQPVEPLEPRRLLATVLWDGGGDGTNWIDPLNWSDDQLPGPGDDVVIDVPSNPTILITNVGAIVRSLSSAEDIGLGGMGSLDVAAASQTSGAFEMAGGTLAGAGDFTINGSFTWTGGTMAAGGRTILAPSGTFSAGGTPLDLQRTLDLGGASVWNQGVVRLAQATINNTGAMVLHGGARILGFSGTNAFNNAGTIDKQGTDAAEIEVAPAPVRLETHADERGGPPLSFTNAGTIDVSTGALVIRAFGTHTGDTSISADGELFLSGLHTFFDGASLTGDGAFLAEPGGDVRFLGNFDFDGTFVALRFGNIRLMGDVSRIWRIDTPGGQVVVAPGGGRVLRSEVLVASSLRLDLTDNNLIVDYGGMSAVNEVRLLVTSGYDGGTWNGMGIFSSTAQTVSGTALGWADAADIYTAFPATFAGQPIDDTTVLVRYTRDGDANLDRIVNLADFNRLAGNFGLSNQPWSRGEFTFDKIVNLADFNRLASQFGQSVGPTSRGLVEQSDDDEVGDLI